MVGISISPAPSRKADTTFWRDPRDGDRLVVERRLGGCALFLGVPLLSIAAWMERAVLTRDPNWFAVAFGLLLGALGAFVLFGRVRDVFERRELVVALQGDLEAYPTALGTVHTSHTT